METTILNQVSSSISRIFTTYRFELLLLLTLFFVLKFLARDIDFKALLFGGEEDD
jgi:hypothetical protein